MRAECPNCRTAYTIPPGAAGKPATCAACGAQFDLIPAVDSASLAPLPRPPTPLEIPDRPPPSHLVPRPAAPLVGCPHCQRPFVSTAGAGGLASCPNCGGAVAIPPPAYYPPQHPAQHALYAPAPHPYHPPPPPAAPKAGPPPTGNRAR